MRRTAARLLPLTVLLTLASLTAAQNVAAQKVEAQSGTANCNVPPAWVAAEGANIFTGERAKDIGDVSVERFRTEFHTIEDNELNRPLREMVARLLQGVPGGPYRVEVSLFDLPTVNAFTLPGERIFVARKLVAFAHGDDELAGVLAHELGHAITHQAETDLSLGFREILGVTEVGSREEVFRRYHEFLENAARKPGLFNRKHNEKEQLIADKLAVLLMARAGYDPQAYSRAWDRIARTEGKTGSGFASFFGMVKPEQKRLREMLETARNLPATCRTAAPPRSDFATWQMAVTAYSVTRQESLAGLTSRISLEGPLRADLDRLQFSPDGRYLLAQDPAGVFVLTREPLKLSFHIAADRISDVHFTPDSRAIVLVTNELREERWDVSTQKREWVREIAVATPCQFEKLSPNGNELACRTYGLEMQLLDTSSSTVVVAKKDFYRPAEAFWGYLAQVLSIAFPWAEGPEMAFSSDGRYFVASAGTNGLLAYDVSARQSMSLPGNVRALLGYHFAFLPDGTLAGIAGARSEKSGIVRFPSGEWVSKQILTGHLAGGARGPYVLIRPIEKYPVGILDIRTQKFFAASKTPAMDVWDDVFVGERKPGEVALYKVGTAEPFAMVSLPQSELAGVRTAVLSDDLAHLAVAQGRRGAVWDLRTNKRILQIHGFEGAYFSGDGKLFVSVPLEMQANGVETGMRIATLDVAQNKVVGTLMLSEEEQRGMKQYGRYVVYTHTASPGQSNGDWLVEVRDVTTNAPQWSRRFVAGSPVTYVDLENGTVVLLLGLNTKAAKELLKQDAALDNKRKLMSDKQWNYYVEVLELATGKTRGKLLIETGSASFRAEHVFAADDWLVLNDDRGRIVLYSLASGEVKSRFFAHEAALSPKAGLMALETESGKVDLYNLPGMEKLRTLEFPVGVAFGRFSVDGARMFVLDRNQTAYLFDTAKLKVK